MFQFVTLPTSTSLFAEVGAWSSPMFTNLLPLAYLIIGFAVGGLVVSALAYKIPEAISNILHHKSDKFS